MKMVVVGFCKNFLMVCFGQIQAENYFPVGGQ